MSDKQINKNGVASQMRAMFLILSMLFCAAIHANPEFQKYTYTDENGITISVSDPRYDYDLVYYPEYDYYWPNGEFSVQVEINAKCTVYMSIGYKSPHSSDPDSIYYSKASFEVNTKINEPFRIAAEPGADRYIKVGYDNYRRLNNDIISFYVNDFISDEDKEKIYAGVSEIPVTDGFSPTIRKEGGNIAIEWNGAECLGSTANVFDLNGGILLSHPIQIAEPETKIPIETIYAGFCIVHIRTEKSTFTKKIKL